MADDQRDDHRRPATSGQDEGRGGPGDGQRIEGRHQPGGPDQGPPGQDGRGGPQGQTYGEAGAYNQGPGQSQGGFEGGQAGGSSGGPNPAGPGYTQQASGRQGAGGPGGEQGGEQGGGQGYTGQTGTGYGQTAGGEYAQSDDPHEGAAHALWDRARHAVSGVLGSGDAPAGGGHKGRGPKGYSRSDARIHDDVNDRLTDDPFLDATHIEVAVQSGEVTLTGTVTARTDKRRAEDLADDVSGVKHVQNNLRVQEVSPDTGGVGSQG